MQLNAAKTNRLLLHAVWRQSARLVTRCRRIFMMQPPELPSISSWHFLSLFSAQWSRMTETLHIPMTTIPQHKSSAPEDTVVVGD